METRSYKFVVPSSPGTSHYTVPGWSVIPKAAMFVMIGLTGTDAAADYSILSVGFSDGTNQGVEGGVADDGQGTMLTRSESSDSSIAADGWGESIGDFVTFEEGGVEIDWSGDYISFGKSVIITFFAGDDYDAELIRVSPGDHVESLDFVSKMILAASTGRASVGHDWHQYLSVGVCTNGVNGLTSNMIGHLNIDSVGTTELGAATDDAYIAGKYDGGWDWRTQVSNIDSVGFNLSDSSSDEILMLCMTFDNNVDSGFSTIPTSGEISITEPGFEPFFLAVFGCNNDAHGSWQVDEDPQGVWIGAYDGTSEDNVGITGEDATGTSNQTSVHSSDIIHFEDPDGNTEFNASFDAFTNDGFDITVNTNPSSAIFFIWWAIGEVPPQEAACAESASITEAQTAQVVFSASVSESASVDDAPAANQEFSGAQAESASADEAQTVQAELNDSTSETASISEAQTVQAELNDSTSESAGISEEQTGLEVNEAAITESVSVDDAPSSQQESGVAVSESASVDDTPIAEKVQADSIAEGASVDDTPVVQADLNATGPESASISEAQTVQAELNDSIAETASIDEVQTALEINEASIDESASVSEAQTVQAELNDSTGESASITEAQAAQAELNDSASESLSITEAQTAVGGVQEGTEETADISEAQTAQAELNDSIAETTSIDEAQTSQAEFNSAVSESASIDDITDGIIEAATGDVAESLSVSEAQDAQLVTYSDITEELAVSAIENASWVSGSEIDESASIDDVCTSLLGEAVYELIENVSRMTLLLQGDSEMTLLLQGDSEMTTLVVDDSEMTEVSTRDSEMTEILNLKSYMQDG